MKRILGAVLALFLLGVSHNNPGHPTSWTYYTVDVPHQTATVLTGINNLKKATGYAFDGAITGATEAVSAEAPYATFAKIGYPGAAHSIASGLSNTFIQVGHYEAPKGTFAYVRDHGKYTSYGNPGTEFYGENAILCPNAGTHCHGEDKNSDPLCVGFETIGHRLQAIEYGFNSKTLTLLNPPGAVDAIATGINGRGRIVGEMTTAMGLSESWVYEEGSYYEFSFPGATRTTALAINWQRDVVGAYTDGAGVTHGFVYYFQAGNSCKLGTTCYTLDESAAGTTSTVVYSINDSDELVGDYTANGVLHGFEAEPVGL